MLRLDTTAAGSRMLGGHRLRKQGFFLRAETAFAMTENLAGVPGYWADDTSTMSHGEGFVTMFQAMMDVPGFYVMDEPVSALSFTTCLRLVALIHQLGQTGAQVVCATHSPILAATPDADIIELGEHGFRRSTWDRLELVDHWRRYLDHPTATCDTSSPPTTTRTTIPHDEQTVTEADALFRQWMRGNLGQAAAHFGLATTGEPVFGWRMRTIGSPASGADGPRWLRVISESPTGHAATHGAATMFQHCKRQEDAPGPRAVLPTVLAQRQLVRALLDGCPVALLPHLLSVYSSISSSVGFYCFDLDDVDSAMRSCDQARTAAQEPATSSWPATRCAT